MKNHSDLIHVLDAAIQIMHCSIKNGHRISRMEIEAKTGISKRSAQRYLKRLEAVGYLVGDREMPQGFRATDKARAMFEVKV